MQAHPLPFEKPGRCFDILAIMFDFQDGFALFYQVGGFEQVAQLLQMSQFEKLSTDWKA